MRKWLSTLGFVLLSLNSIMAQQQQFEIQGHRGARGLMPENTIPAFLRAIDEGVQTVELDVVISKDKKVVVSHDPYFNPDISTSPEGNPITEETKGNLYALKYSEIKKYDVGLRGHPGYPEQIKMKAHKPTLKKVIKAVEKYTKSNGKTAVKYNIEIKSLQSEYRKSQPEVPEFSDLVHDVIFKILPPERVVIQSFDFNVLKHWYSKIHIGEYQNATLAALIEPYDENDIDFNLNKLGFKPDIWSPNYLHVNQDRVNKLHYLGISIIPWTVNEIKDMKAMKAMGCDGLITDYPDRAKNL